MVKVTFDYGNKEDLALIREMIGEPVVVPQAITATDLAERVESTRKIVEKKLKSETTVAETLGETLDKRREEAVAAVIKEAPAAEAKTITAAEALPKIAAYCQANGLDKPQAYFARIGKANIQELTPTEILDLLTELGIEV